jgi:anaphase-promoting complex subunit 1
MPRAGIELLDDRLPVWPPDMSAVLYSRISNPEWKAPWHDELRVQTLAEINPSFAFGSSEFLQHLDDLTRVYVCLANAEGDSRMRAENVIRFLADTKRLADLERLPLGLAAPVREAARTCQLSPPADWTPAAYSMIGRNDLAATATKAPDLLFNDGYRAPKEYIVNYMLLLDHYSMTDSRCISNRILLVLEEPLTIL